MERVRGLLYDGTDVLHILSQVIVTFGLMVDKLCDNLTLMDIYTALTGLSRLYKEKEEKDVKLRWNKMCVYMGRGCLYGARGKK